MTELIPHTLHLIWFQGWHQLPQQYQQSVDNWHQLHPDWDIQLWDQYSIESLLGEWREVYSMCYHMISRCDVGRLAILDKLGGVYADVDTDCFQPLDNLLYAVQQSGNTGFLAQGTVPLLSLIPGHRRLLQTLNIPSVSNCGMGFTARHPFLQQLRQQIHANMTSWLSDMVHMSKALEVVWTTGPVAVAMALKKSPQGVKILPLDCWQSRQVVGGPTKDDYLQLASQGTAYCAHWGASSWYQSAGGLWWLVLVVVLLIVGKSILFK